MNNNVVGFDAKRAFNNTTGLGNYSRFVLNALLKTKQNCIAFTPKVKNDLFKDFPKNLIRTSSWPKFLHSFWRSYGIVSDLKKENIKIFHGLSNELPKGLKKANIASVVTIHDLIFKRFPALYSPIDRWFYDQKSAFSCRNADVIVAVSEQTKRDIITFYGIDAQKIKVIYQDCHADFQKVCSTTQKQAVLKKHELQKPFVLCVGTLEERKNQENLIRGFNKAFSGQNIDLVLVGNGKKYLEKLMALVQKLGVSNQVKFLTKVPFQDLPALYQSAQIFAYLSYFEGFGIPIVEALHSGTPVLAATGSCLEEAGGDGAMYVSPNDVSEITASLIALWNDESLRNRLIMNGQSHIKNFAAQKIATALQTIYSSF